MDLIDRQAIHDTVIARYPDSDATQYSVGYADAINDVLKDIRYMPSAEPKTAKRIVGFARNGMTMMKKILFVGDAEGGLKMSDLISRQEAIDAICTWDKFGVDERGRIVRWHEGLEPYVHLRDVVTAIVNLPSAEPVQKTGKWIDDNGNRTQQYRNNFKCSECGHYQHTPVAKRVDEFEQENKFCHWCGSLMRGDTDD